MWQIEGLRQLPGVFLMDDGILALGSKEFMEENLSFTCLLYTSDAADEL